MVPFNLQVELHGQLLTISVEQLDQLPDAVGYIRYQIQAADRRSVVLVSIEAEQLFPEDNIGLSGDDVFTPDEISVIAAAIREYNSGRRLTFDQLTFDF
jgi:hypothetical protein